MMLLEAVKKMEAAGMNVLLEADPGPSGGSKMKAYAWSDEDGYECYITVPVGIYDRLDEAEVAVLERVITKRRRNAAA